MIYGGAPQLINPRASDSAASCVAFHPTRQSLFLVAFRDGSLALFNATRLARVGSGGSARSGAGQSTTASPDAAEVASFARLHQSVGVADGETGCITGAMFLPNAKARAVTVGLDGKCNIVDFDKGSVVKSWHIKGACYGALGLLPCREELQE